MRYLIAAILLCVAASAAAQEPRTAVITFDAVTTYADGTPIEAGTVVEYRLYQGARGSEKVMVAQFSGTEFDVNTGLPPGETCWQVTAIAHDVESEPSNEACKAFAWPAPGRVTITVR